MFEQINKKQNLIECLSLGDGFGLRRPADPKIQLFSFLKLISSFKCQKLFEIFSLFPSFFYSTKKTLKSNSKLFRYLKNLFVNYTNPEELYCKLELEVREVSDGHELFIRRINLILKVYEFI